MQRGSSTRRRSTWRDESCRGNAHGRLRLTALAKDAALAPAAIHRVEALGSTEPLALTRHADVLDVRLPAGRAGTSAVAVKIRGAGIA